MPLARRRLLDPPMDASASASLPVASAPLMEALGDTATEAPAVLIRLLLLARDEVTGEKLLAGSFLKQMSVPPDPIGPGIDIAVELFGERRVFKPTGIIWDQPNRVCVVEIEWMVADPESVVDK